MSAPAWLEALLPFRPGQRVRQPADYGGATTTYEGLEARAFTAAERAELGATARAFTRQQFREGQARSRVVLDLAAFPCPLLAVIVGAHEHGHVLEDANLGAVTRRGPDQERAAWEFARIVAGKFLTPGQLSTCLEACAIADPRPDRCRQAEAGGLDALLERVRGRAAPLHAPMLEALSARPEFFGRVRESDRRGGRLLLRESSGRILGPARRDDRALRVWTQAVDGRPLAELDPRRQLWSADN